jgi:hypothetical protein
VPKLQLNVDNSLPSGRRPPSELAPLVPPITPRDNLDFHDTLVASVKHDSGSPAGAEQGPDWFDDFDFSSFRSSEAYILSADSHDGDETEEGSLRDIVSMDSMSSFIGDDSSEASPRGGGDPLADDYDPWQDAPHAASSSSSDFLHRSPRTPPLL